jgi:hypothetical protein
MSVATASFATTASYALSSNAMVYRGVWNGTTYGYYLINDVVTYSGSSYICNNAVFGNTPPDQDLSFTALAASASFATTAISASYASTSSYLKGSEIYVDSIFPTTGNSVNRIFTENSNTGFGPIGSTVIYTSTTPLILNAGSGTSTVQVTGSLSVTNGITGSFSGSFSGSLEGTASVAVTASYAATSSYATNLTVANTLTLDATLTDYASITSSIVGSNNLFSPNTGSYTSAFFKYTATSGSNTRAGEVISAWNGSTTTYTDFSTVDIGNTSAVTTSISIVTGQVQFNIQTNSSGWRIKSIGTFM